jgi:hypothetical protein
MIYNLEKLKNDRYLMLIDRPKIKIEATPHIGTMSTDMRDDGPFTIPEAGTVQITTRGNKSYAERVDITGVSDEDLHTVLYYLENRAYNTIRSTFIFQKRFALLEQQNKLELLLFVNYEEN